MVREGGNCDEVMRAGWSEPGECIWSAWPSWSNVVYCSRSKTKFLNFLHTLCIGSLLQ